MTTALYMRMSTDKQENSIDSQREILTAYAKAHKMRIAREYIDEGISGRKADKRPAFMQMIEDSSGDEFDAVLIYDSSRFARNLEESLVYKSVLKKNGVTIISATEPTMDDDTSLITDALLGAMNEMYSRKLSKAVRRGMSYRAERGYYQNVPPFGYSHVFKDGIPQIDEAQAAVVRMIFEKFTTDTPSFIGLIRFLNDNGYYTARGGYWDIKGVQSILTNITYTGLVPWSGNAGEPYKGLHKPIIPPELFERAQELYSRRLTPRRPRDCGGYRHWLSGMIFCERCGKVMAYNRNNNPKYCLFRCIDNAKGLCNPRNAIYVPKAENFVIEAIKSIENDEYAVDINSIVRRPNGGEGKIDELRKRAEKLNARLARQREAYENGVDTLEEYRDNKIKTMNEIQEATAKLDALVCLAERKLTEGEALASLKDRAVGLVGFLNSDENSVAQKSAAVRELVYKAVYNQTTGEFSIFFLC